MTHANALPRWLAAALLTGGLLIPVLGHAEAGHARDGGGARASLNFTVIIPPVLQVVENTPSAPLQADGSGAWLGRQRLVVMSNLKQGFCAQLRSPAGTAEGWTLEVPASRGLSAERVADGWRVCSRQAGRQELELQHRFQTLGAAPVWPVATDITAL